MQLPLLLALLCLTGAYAKIDDKESYDKLEELLEKTESIEKAKKLVELAEEEEELEDDEDDDVITTPLPENEEQQLCKEHRCPWGKECYVKNQIARCRCTSKCPVYSYDTHVCSNHNSTFSSICDLYRERCLCRDGDLRCIKEANAKVHLEYMGKCKALDACTDDMMSQFADRMADWLFQVMKELNHREELSSTKWEALASKAESDPSFQHIYPVIWKYCDLDIKPHDSHVTHHELIPLIAPVMPMESCIKPFLEGCDQDSDKKITLKEWGNCLGVHEDEFLEHC